MNAAKTSSTEAIHLLLKKDTTINGDGVLADPNVADEDDRTALAFSLNTNNTQVINTLAEVTTEAGEATMKMLAQANVKIEGELEKYVKKILNDGHTALPWHNINVRCKYPHFLKPFINN